MVKHNGLAAIAYIFGFITGILVFLIADRGDRFVRFHAAQSIFFCISVWIIGTVISLALMPFALNTGIWGMPGMMGPFAIVFSAVWIVYVLVVFLVWLFLILKAYAGHKYKLPLIGNLAESISG